MTVDALIAVIRFRTDAHAELDALEARVSELVEALERIIADIETNSEAGAPQYLWDAVQGQA